MLRPIQNHTPEGLVDQITKDYEDFAYIVSHDLNAPLRHIKGFTHLLIGTRKDDLTNEEQEYIAFLEQALTKLDDMQHALLTFSRLNTRAGDMRAVNCNHAVSAALKELDDQLNLYGPELECGELPTITAEPRQIELLFFHLIDNALKFHEPDAQNRKISITAQNQGKTWLFAITDNGIGIDEKYHREVFRMFKRLQPEKFPGIGTGLAFAHRIIQRHNGTIFIESGPDKGTRMLFSLPQ